MNQLAPFLQALSAEHGWLTAILTWMASARVFAKLCSPQLQQFFTDALLWVSSSKERDDDEFVLRVLMNPFYRVFAWLLDYLLSVKLPTTAQFEAMQQPRNP
jgi:hypothetical protein